MEVKFAQTLEVIKYKNRIVLCLIRVAPRKLKYYYGQLRPHVTHRWMRTEDWSSFDVELKRILNNNLREEKPNAEHDECFWLNAMIQVRVKRSHIPLAMLCRLSSSEGEEQLNEADVALSLECCIEYRDDGKWLDQAESADHSLEQEDVHEYEPQFVCSQTGVVGQNTSTEVVDYAAYKPATKNDSSEASTIAIGESDLYSPQPVMPLDICESAEIVPAYSAARIPVRDDSKETSTFCKADKQRETDEICVSDRDKLRSRERQRTTRVKGNCSDNSEHDDEFSQRNKRKHTSKQREECTKPTREEKVHRKKTKSHKHDRPDSLRSTKSNQIESTKDNPAEETSTSRLAKCTIDKSISTDKHQSSKSEDETMVTEPRRLKSSNLSPIDESGPKKSSQVLELFGSDDDEDRNKISSSSNRTPKAVQSRKTAASSESSAKSKRKRDLTEGCEKEKIAMDSWLVKDKKHSNSSSSTSAEATRKKRRPSPQPHCSSDSYKQSEAYLSRGEVEKHISKENETIQKNRQLRKVLVELAGPTPKRVETLSLNDMSSKDILDTFVEYKPRLDEIFRKSKHASHVHGYKGIDHCLVISLIDERKQLEIMNKLSDIYEKCGGEGSSSSVYVTLFANAMMPEWLIGIFCRKYNFTREEAIEQVKAQNAYKVHLEAQEEHTFPFA